MWVGKSLRQAPCGGGRPARILRAAGGQCPTLPTLVTPVTASPPSASRFKPRSVLDLRKTLFEPGLRSGFGGGKITEALLDGHAQLRDNPLDELEMIALDVARGEPLEEPLRHVFELRVGGGQLFG